MGYRRTANAKRKGRRVYKKRRETVDVRKLAVVIAATVVAVLCGYFVYSHLPFVKVNKAIAAGNKYSQSSNYEEAISSYLEALAIDSESVTAYSNLAGAYLSIDDTENAKSVLYQGWQNTQNQGLLDNYHTVILNEAVATMNAQETDLNTVLSIMSVLEEDTDNVNAVELLGEACERCFVTSYSSDANQLFRSDDENMPTYKQYENLINSMLSVYEAAPSEELKKVIREYAVPNIDSFTLNYEDVESYKELLTSVSTAVGTDEEIDSFSACLSNSQEVLAVFSDIFAQLDVGNVDELRDFIVSDEYISLRDLFLNDGETPQENTTYIPISREAIILNRDEGVWSYRFLNFEENPTTSGVITLWANYFVDDGVQRTAVSYEPAAIDGNLYPHTEYSVTYLYSYITSGGSTKVAQMNYRLDTSITYEDGTIDETIVGDWGGSDEWVMDIDTIESRIKA